jgi:hypothetical protein
MKTQDVSSARSSSTQASGIETPSFSNTQSIDISSGKWIHELHLHDDSSPKISVTSSVKVVPDERHPQCDNSFPSSSVNPFLKYPCVADRPSHSSSPAISAIHSPLSRTSVEEKHQPPDEPLSSLPLTIQPSRWKHLALGLGKPFLRRHTISSSPTPISTTKSFLELLSQRESPKFPSSLMRPAFPWPSLDSLTSRRSMEKRSTSIIREPMIKQFHVTPLLDDLQQRLSSVCLGKGTSSLDRSWLRRLANVFRHLRRGLLRYLHRVISTIACHLKWSTCRILYLLFSPLFLILLLTLLLAEVSFGILPLTFLNNIKEGFPRIVSFPNKAYIGSPFFIRWSSFSLIRPRWIDSVLSRTVTGIYSSMTTRNMVS